MISIKIEGNGLQMPKRIQGQIKTMKKNILREMGMKGKQYARENIIKSGAEATGNLLKSLHFRTTANYSEVWTDAPHAGYLEFGSKPHWVYASMISPAGYSVADWMNMKMKKPVWRFWADGKNTKGIFFMSNAYKRLLKETPTIIKKHVKVIK